MRLIVVSAWLLGTSAALDPRRALHHVRQAVSDAEITEAAHDPTGTGATTKIVTPTATSTISDSSSYVCSSQLEDIAAAMPTEPPEYSSFSRSYYDTHPRTADSSAFDCAWIKDLPEELDEVTLEDQNRTTEWFMALDPKDDGELFDKAMAYLGCASENVKSQPCQEEFDTYANKVQGRAESAGTHKRDALRFASIPASVLAAVGASSFMFL